MNPFEAELAGVHWALTKEHYFTCGAPHIIVYCDCEGLARFLAGDMEKITNKRARAMAEEIQIYPLEVIHVPGAKMGLIDHGSRHPISFGQHKQFETEAGDLGICERSNRITPMESSDVKDPKVEILAAMAMEQQRPGQD